MMWSVTTSASIILLSSHKSVVISWHVFSTSYMFSKFTSLLFFSWLLECGRTGRRVPEERYFVDSVLESNNVERLNISQAALQEETLSIKRAESVAINTDAVHQKKLMDDKSKTATSASEVCTPKAVETVSVPAYPGDNSFDSKNCAAHRLKNYDTKTSVSVPELFVKQSGDAQKLMTVVDDALSSDKSPKDLVFLNNREKAGDENENSRPSPLEERAVEAVSGKISKTPKAVLKNQTVEVREQL
jgi:hypothetical protein